jgi:transcriptional regulator with XRE-family HTH domain
MCYYFMSADGIARTTERVGGYPDGEGEDRMDGTVGRLAGAPVTVTVPRPVSTLAQYVKGRRLAHRLSQADLASRCGVSQKSISLIESGQTVQPRLGLLDRLAAALGEPRASLERLVLVEQAPDAAISQPRQPSASHLPPPPDAPAAQAERAVMPPRSPRPSAVSVDHRREPPASDARRQARGLVDALLVQAVNHPSDDVVALVRQTASYLADQYDAVDRADRSSVELAIDSSWIVGRTYANVARRRLTEGDAYFDHAADLARRIRDWDRWAQAVWRKANHHRKLDDLLVGRDLATLRQARADYDLAFIWLENVLESRASAAWRSVAHAECAKIAISTNRETLFAEHIEEARRLAASASASAAPPVWPPFLPEYAEVLWRDRYLLGMAVFNAGTEHEMHQLVEEARQFRNGLTAPFDRVMLPLSQTLREIRSGDQAERERGALRGWRIIRSARAMGLDNFARLAVRALSEADLLECGRGMYEAEVRARRGG